MALVTCYDAVGNAHQKESVDARECCQHCGYTMAPPNGEAAQPSESQVIADDKVREAAKAAQVIVQAAPETRAYNRKVKE